jgi:hypothetical protein
MGNGLRRKKNRLAGLDWGAILPRGAKCYINSGHSWRGLTVGSGEFFFLAGLFLCTLNFFPYRFTELHNFNWIRDLADIHSPDQLEEFTLLFMALSSITLNEQKDVVAGKWTSNGKYSVSSTYECQFLRSIINFPAIDVWKARIEQKCKFFSWLVLHNRVLTTDNMLKRNCPCNQSCSFYLCMDETTPHLLTSCNYTEAVWNLIANFQTSVLCQPKGG